MRRRPRQGRHGRRAMAVASLVALGACAPLASCGIKDDPQPRQISREVLPPELTSDPGTTITGS